MHKCSVPALLQALALRSHLTDILLVDGRLLNTNARHLTLPSKGGKRLTQKTTNNNQPLWCDCSTFPTQDSFYVQEGGGAVHGVGRQLPPLSAPIGVEGEARQRLKTSAGNQLGGAKDNLKFSNCMSARTTYN